jgi:hypothetical protein
MKLLCMIMMPLSLSAFPYELMFKLHYSQFCNYRTVRRNIQSRLHIPKRSTPGVTKPERTEFHALLTLHEQTIKKLQKQQELCNIFDRLKVLITRIESLVGKEMERVD